jgi:hypothetical protein
LGCPEHRQVRRIVESVKSVEYVCDTAVLQDKTRKTIVDSRITDDLTENAVYEERRAREKLQPKRAADQNARVFCGSVVDWAVSLR